MGNSKQYRIFTGVLYPDSKSYDYQVILKVLGDTFDEFAYITHDADVDSEGKPKKVHVHWLGRLQNPTTIGGISLRTTLPAHDIEAGRVSRLLFGIWCIWMTRIKPNMTLLLLSQTLTLQSIFAMEK